MYIYIHNRSMKYTRNSFLQVFFLDFYSYPCYSHDTHQSFISPNVTFFGNFYFFSSNKPLPVFDVLSLPPYLTICNLPSPSTNITSHPLQVYNRHPHANDEIVIDSSPKQSSSPATTLPLANNLPIAFRKGNQCTRNSYPIYNFMSSHRLSSSNFAFVLFYHMFPFLRPPSRLSPIWASDK